MAVNEGSRAVLAALGMRLVRTFALSDLGPDERSDVHEVVPGSEHGQVEYAVTREQWLAGLASGG